MIEAQELSKDYGSTRALRGASFTIEDNEVVGLLGPNGAGKTTLMKILTGYLHPTAGKATIGGTDVLEDPLSVQAQIGYLPESAPLYPDMLVQEYLLMMAELRELPEHSRLELVSRAVRATGLEGYLIKPIGQLSKGYRQRVGLAQAILHRPRVLILDEPTSGLDPTQIVEIRELIKQLAKHATVLLSTHILPEVEVTCERVLIISEGELRTDAKLDELRGRGGAIAAVSGPLDEIAKAFEALDEVDEVAQLDTDGPFTRFRVSGDSGGEQLCPQLYDVVRERGWRLAELRPDRQTLESIFRGVVDQGAAS